LIDFFREVSEVIGTRKGEVVNGNENKGEGVACKRAGDYALINCFYGLYAQS
jgi:hypothetical protein